MAAPAPPHTFRTFVPDVQPHPTSYALLAPAKKRLFINASADLSAEDKAQRAIEEFFEPHTSDGFGAPLRANLGWYHPKAMDLMDLRAKSEEGYDVTPRDTAFYRAVEDRMRTALDGSQLKKVSTASGDRDPDGAIVACCIVSTHNHPHVPSPPSNARSPTLASATAAAANHLLNRQQAHDLLAPTEKVYAISPLVLEAESQEPGKAAEGLVQLLGYMLGAHESVGTWLGMFFRQLDFGRVAVVDLHEMLIEWGDGGFAPGEVTRSVGELDALLQLLGEFEGGATPHALLTWGDAPPSGPRSRPTGFPEAADSVAWQTSCLALDLVRDRRLWEPLHRLERPTGPQWESLRAKLRLVASELDNPSTLADYVVETDKDNASLASPLPLTLPDALPPDTLLLSSGISQGHISHLLSSEDAGLSVPGDAEEDHEGVEMDLGEKLELWRARGGNARARGATPGSSARQDDGYFQGLVYDPSETTDSEMSEEMARLRLKAVEDVIRTLRVRFTLARSSVFQQLLDEARPRDAAHVTT
ncbi:hypothetical protein IAT38_001248 [Cryptococcus sp. DSM 104549]